MRYKNSLLFAVIKIILPLFYFTALVYAVFFARRRRHLTIRYLNIIPLKKLLVDFHHMAAMGAFNYYSNLLGNIILFIPMPFLLAWYFRMNQFLWMLFTGFVISVGIETIQYIFDVGVADIDDVILNTLGTCIGIFCYKTLQNIFQHSTYSGT